MLSRQIVFVAKLSFIRQMCVQSTECLVSTAVSKFVFSTGSDNTAQRSARSVASTLALCGEIFSAWVRAEISTSDGCVVNCVGRCLQLHLPIRSPSAFAFACYPSLFVSICVASSVVCLSPSAFASLVIHLDLPRSLIAL